jgi:hypothetical protein
MERKTRIGLITLEIFLFVYGLFSIITYRDSGWGIFFALSAILLALFIHIDIRKINKKE